MAFNLYDDKSGFGKIAKDVADVSSTNYSIDGKRARIEQRLADKRAKLGINKDSYDDSDSSEILRLKGGDSPEVFHDIVPTGDAKNARKKVYEQVAYLNGISLDEAVKQVDAEAAAYKSDNDLGNKIAQYRKDGLIDKDYQFGSWDIYNAGNKALEASKIDAIYHPNSAYNKLADYATDEQGHFGRFLSDNKDYTNRQINSGYMIPGSDDQEQYKNQLKMYLNAKDKSKGNFGNNVDPRVMDAILNTSYMAKQYGVQVGKAGSEAKPKDFEFGLSSLVDTAINAGTDYAMFVPEVLAAGFDAGVWTGNQINDAIGGQKLDFSMLDKVRDAKKYIKEDILGYDGKAKEAAQDKFMKDAFSIYKDENMDTTEKAWQFEKLMFKNADLIPDLVADSYVFVKEMGMSIVSGKAIQEGSKLYKFFNNLNKGNGKLAKKVDDLNKINKVLENAKATGKLSKGKGFLATSANRMMESILSGKGVYRSLIDTEETLDKRAENNLLKPEGFEEWPDDKKKAWLDKNKIVSGTSLSDAIITFFSTYAMNSIDALTDRATMGISATGSAAKDVLKGGLSSLGKKMFGDATKVVGKVGKESTKAEKAGVKQFLADLANGTVGKIASTTAKGIVEIGASQVVEGFTESIQEAINVYNERTGTNLYEDKEFLGMLDEKTQFRILGAGAVGALAGGGQNAGGQAVSGVIKLNDKRKYNNAMKQVKEAVKQKAREEQESQVQSEIVPDIKKEAEQKAYEKEYADPKVREDHNADINNAEKLVDKIKSTMAKIDIVRTHGGVIGKDENGDPTIQDLSDENKESIREIAIKNMKDVQDAMRNVTDSHPRKKQIIADLANQYNILDKLSKAKRDKENGNSNPYSGVFGSEPGAFDTDGNPIPEEDMPEGTPKDIKSRVSDLTFEELIGTVDSLSDVGFDLKDEDVDQLADEFISEKEKREGVIEGVGGGAQQVESDKKNKQNIQNIINKRIKLNKAERSIDSVSQQASDDDVIGFNTYYKNMKTARKNVDNSTSDEDKQKWEDVYNKNQENLARFSMQHKSKQASLEKVQSDNEAAFEKALTDKYGENYEEAEKELIDYHKENPKQNDKSPNDNNKTPVESYYKIKSREEFKTTKKGENSEELYKKYKKNILRKYILTKITNDKDFQNESFEHTYGNGKKKYKFNTSYKTIANKKLEEARGKKYKPFGTYQILERIANENNAMDELLNANDITVDSEQSTTAGSADTSKGSNSEKYSDVSSEGDSVNKTDDTINTEEKTTDTTKTDDTTNAGEDTDTTNTEEYTTTSTEDKSKTPTEPAKTDEVSEYEKQVNESKKRLDYAIRKKQNIQARLNEHIENLNKFYDYIKEKKERIKELKNKKDEMLGYSDINKTKEEIAEIDNEIEKTNLYLKNIDKSLQKLSKDLNAKDAQNGSKNDLETFTNPKEKAKMKNRLVTAMKKKLKDAGKFENLLKKANDKISSLFKMLTKKIKDANKKIDNLKLQKRLKEVKLNNQKKAREKAKENKYTRDKVESIKSSDEYIAIEKEIDELKKELEFFKYGEGLLSDERLELTDVKYRVEQARNEVNKEIKDLREDLSVTKKSKELLEPKNRNSFHKRGKDGNSPMPSSYNVKEDVNEKQTETNISRIVKIKKKSKSLLSTISTEKLNNNIKQYARHAISILKESIPKITFDESYKLKDSPARALLFNEKGEINENVAAAIAMAMDELMAINSSSLQFNDDRTIAKIFGVQEENVTQAMRTVAAFAGASRRFVANDLGTAIANNLAITQNDKDADNRLYSKLIQDLGQMALVYGEAMGYIEPLSDTFIPKAAISFVKEDIAKSKNKDYEENEEYDDIKGMPTVKLSEKYKPKEDGSKNDVLEKLKAQFNEMKEQLLLEENIKHYRTSEYKEPRKHTVRNQPMSDVNPKTQQTANELENMGFEINISAVKDFLTNVEVLGRKQALKLMGFIDLKVIEEGKDGKDNKYSYEDSKGRTRKATSDEVESINARNNQIIKSFDELVLLADKVEKGEINNEIFYDWFISKNGRFFIDSAVTNPQTDKMLHRFLITPKEQNLEVDSNKDKEINPFYYAIAQSMGFDIDKSYPTDIIKFAKKVLDTDLSEIKKVLQGDTVEVTFGDGKKAELEIEHLGHFIQGLQAIESYKKRGEDGKFNTNISFETDAVTSAFGIKLLQFPIFGDIIHWAAKTGIFLNEKGRDPDKKDKDPKAGDNGIGNAHGLVFNLIRSMGQAINEGVQDSYKTLASNVTLKPAESLDSRSNTKGRPSDAEQAATDRNVAIFNLMKDILPDIFELNEDNEKLIDEFGNQVVTKAARNMFKYPFMTFNYAAGMRTIARNLANTLLEDVPNKILNDEMDEVLAKVIEDAAIVSNKTMSEDEIKNRIAEIKLELQSKPKDMIRLFKVKKVDKNTGKEKIVNTGPKLMEKMNETVIKVYGDAVKESMESQFSELVDANERISQSFRLMFRAYGIKYNEAIKDIEKKNNGVVTLEDKKKVLKDLRKTFPIIKSPFSDTEYDDGVAINDSRLEDVKGEGFTAYTHYMKDGKDSMLKSAGMIREFEEAIAAGSVLPIHYIDGTLIDGVLEDGDTLGIHDAFIAPLLKMGDKSIQYNKDMYEINKNYSMVDEVYDSLVRSMSTLSDEQFEQINLENKDSSNPIRTKNKETGKSEIMDLNDIFKNITELAQKVHDQRNKIYSMSAKIFHMSSMEDTGYIVNEDDANGIKKRMYNTLPLQKGKKLSELNKEAKEAKNTSENENTSENKTKTEPANSEYTKEQVKLIKEVLFQKVKNSNNDKYGSFIRKIANEAGIDIKDC